MLVDYKNCKHLSPHNNAIYTHLGKDVGSGQTQYICSKGMLLTRNEDAQYQQYIKIIYKILLEEIPVLLPKCEEPKRCKRGIVGLLFRAARGIASKAA